MFIKKNRVLKSFVSLLFVVSLYLGTTISLLASPQDLNIIIKRENIQIENQIVTVSILQSKASEIRVVRATAADGETSLVSYNEKTGDMTINTIEGDTTCEQHLNLKADIVVKREPSVAGANGDQWWDYQYTINTNNRWNLQIGINNCIYFKNVTETSSNTLNLFGFKEAVDELCRNELLFESVVCITVTSTLIATLTSAASGGVTAVVAALVAVGGAISAAPIFYDAYRNAKDAQLYFKRV